MIHFGYFPKKSYEIEEKLVHGKVGKGGIGGLDPPLHLLGEKGFVSKRPLDSRQQKHFPYIE